MSLERRIARLEALEAIRLLKHRYLNACDLKDVDAIRACFAGGEVLIDYGPLGVFRDREPFLALYRELACVPRVIDLHHAANPEIELHGEDEARARWALHYQNRDGESGATRQLGGFYQDRYRCVDGQWLIVETVFRGHFEVARTASA
ncbi:nuclear transport factor 2 family protein [Pseudomonas citronellolis]|uniref:nuclear transport factor 2 family protein n=1 Tax=Pseudomonas citronellolis TaxID=53408 RepID=UPI0023E45F21|nr:nuclear transport factor 2 family protein [Pseudomonas citronellolis]MDF3935174.1 nuclear transport factor 2 family protein [Pseudomonas citronellolis]